MSTSIAILAAGLGTRMRSKRAKVLHRAGGLALVEHVVAAAREIAAAERIVVVTGHQAADVKRCLRPHRREFRGQDPATWNRPCARMLPGEVGNTVREC